MAAIPATQGERRQALIRALLAERTDGGQISVPEDAGGQRRLLRSLMNMRPPMPIAREVLAVQDAYLLDRAREKGIVDASALPYTPEGITVRLGDITTLAADAIVNAANSQMLGCFHPCHGCIDNAIHTYAGMQLRLECSRAMREQGHEEPVGRARVTPGYNLPARHVIHTVGPQCPGGVALPRERGQLASCYRACLDAAAEAGCRTLAFCCISTGVFGFPHVPAATIAVETVRTWSARHPGELRVVFDVFDREDEEVYRELALR